MEIPHDEFEALAMAEMDSLYRVARRLARDQHAAADLVQETFLRALRGRAGFRLQEHGIRPWLLRIMHNLYFTQSRRERRQPTAVEGQALNATAAPADEGSSTDPAEPGVAGASAYAVHFDAMDERLVAALNELSQEYQVVLLLWAVEGLSYKEISHVADVPIGTVMSRLYRARQRIGRRLRGFAEAEGFTRAVGGAAGQDEERPPRE